MNTTNSQDRPMNLGELLDAYKTAIWNGLGSTAQRGAIEDHFAFELGIAKTAYGAEKARADEEEEALEREKEFSHSIENRAKVAEARARTAESRLAEIQRGVEGLRTYFIAAYSHPAYDTKFVALQDVLALIAPQGQANDTSGLPG